MHPDTTMIAVSREGIQQGLSRGCDVSSPMANGSKELIWNSSLH